MSDKPTKRVEQMDFDELQKSKTTAAWLYWVFFVFGAMLTTGSLFTFLVGSYIIGIVCSVFACCLLLLLLSISMMRDQIDERLAKEFRGK